MDRNQANEYINRINRVYDYIENNLGNEMTLKELASVAGFSEFHFHRIFAAMTGETLFSFILRLRVERSAHFLCSPLKARSITKIATDLGFSSSAVFTRTFKKHFGCTPTEYRNSNQSQKVSNISKLLRNDGKAPIMDDGYNRNTRLREIKNWRFSMKPEVKIEKIDKMRVGYIRYVGPYAGDSQLFENLYGRLGAWAGPRGIDLSTSYIIYHDDPSITDEDKLRMSICVPIGNEIEVSGEVCEMTIGGGEYAVGRFELASDEYGNAWSYMCGEYLPNSGYMPADSSPFERYIGGECAESGKIKVDICIPVEK